MGEQEKSYQNPYRPLVGDGESFFPKERFFSDMDGYFVHTQEASNLEVISERGIGGSEAIRLYLRSRKDRLRFRIVECDVLSHFPGGTSVNDFYRDLVNHVKESLGTLPEIVTSFSDFIASSNGLDFQVLKNKVRGFFRALRVMDPEHPILLVFYHFDRLPNNYPFAEGDWIPLRQLYNELDNRLYYLIHTRIRISVLEELKLINSIFGGVFPPPYRLGLLSTKESDNLVIQPGKESVNENPWPDWLKNKILDWGGRNQACLEIICFHLFELIWNQHCQYNEENIPELENKLYNYLKQAYFARLFNNVKNDDMLDALAHAATKGFSSSLIPKIDELVALGYFIPELAEKRQYVLFSPLFKRYLVERGVIEDTSVSQPLPDLKPASPKVAEILNMKELPKEILQWFDEEFKERKRLQRKPELDKYSQRFLTGVFMGLSENELSELKSKMFEDFYIEYQEKGNHRDKGDLRRYFHTEVNRWKDKYLE